MKGGRSGGGPIAFVSVTGAQLHIPEDGHLQTGWGIEELRPGKTSTEIELVEAMRPQGRLIEAVSEDSVHTTPDIFVPQKYS